MQNNSAAPATGNTPAASTQNQALYVIGANGIQGFTIGSDGSLTAIPGGPFASSIHARSLIPSPSGRSILALDCCGADGILRVWVLRVDPSGTLRADSTPALQAIPQPRGAFPSLGISSSGKFIYLSEFMGPAVVSAHSFDEAGGTVSSTPSSQFQFGIPCSDVMFCSQSTTIAGDSVAAGTEYLWVKYGNCGFHVDCDNLLQPLPVSGNGATLGTAVAGTTNTGGSEFTGISIVAGAAVEVHHLECCTVTSIGSYAFQNGQLTPAQGCAFDDPACVSAWSVALHPDQQMVLIGTGTGLLMSRRDAAGNLSTPVATNISLPTRADNLLFDQGGHNIYVLGFDNSIFGFSVDANTGTMKPVPGSPWTLGLFDTASAVIMELPGTH